MSTFYATFLSKSDFSFALLLVSFEPLEVEQSYIPHLKALMCGINAAGAQRCGYMFTFCHAYLKMGVLLHKMEIVHNQNFMTVFIKVKNLIHLMYGACGLGSLYLVREAIKFPRRSSVVRSRSTMVRMVEIKLHSTFWNSGKLEITK